MNTEQTVHGLTGLAWFKSSYSSELGGNCIEVAAGADAVHVRDSKDKDAGALAFSPEVWAAFVGFATGWIVTD